MRFPARITTAPPDRFRKPSIGQRPTWRARSARHPEGGRWPSAFGALGIRGHPQRVAEAMTSAIGALGSGGTGNAPRFPARADGLPLKSRHPETE